MAGYVQQAHVRAGDAVKAGQLLMELADQDLLLERQRWQSQLAQYLDGLAAAQARADRAQLVILQSRADEAQAQLDLVEERLQRSRLIAPFDALVVQGDWSQQLGTPVKEGAELFVLAPSDRFRVMVEIDERDIARMAQVAQTPLQGQLTLSAMPWESLPLRVTRLSPVAKAVEGRNVFEVEAELLQPRSGLRPGLQGQARIESQAASPLLHWARRGLGSLRLAWWEWMG
jgi:multidrug resistance efflux pump